MKIIFTLIGLFFYLNSYSQSKFEPASAHHENYCTEFDIIVHSKFTNNFSSDKLKFIRTQNTITPKWSSAFCDCELCHDSGTDSATFTLPIGEFCETSGHFYPSSTKGTGAVKIKVFPENDRSTFVVGEFNASCWGASATFVAKEKLAVTPNPANTILTVGFGSVNPYTINIVSSDGKLVLKQNVQNLTNTLNISDLSKGLYFVRIESEGKLFSSRFIKL